LAGVVLFALVSTLAWLLGRVLMGSLPGLTGDTYGALDEAAELAALALVPICIRAVG
jgi:cobalamin synthase